MSEQTNITPEHKKTFEALLTSGEYKNFALFSCFANGDPVVAIVAITHNAEQYTVTPMFISLPPSVEITDHDGNPAMPL